MDAGQGKGGGAEASGRGGGGGSAPNAGLRVPTSGVAAWAPASTAGNSSSSQLDHAKRALERAARDANVSGFLILLVEDDLFQQMAVRELLKSVEAQHPGIRLKLVVAASGAEAVTAAKAQNAIDPSNSFNLVLLDYNLPGGMATSSCRSSAKRLAHWPPS